MRDEKGRPVDVFVVCGRRESSELKAAVPTRIDLLLRTGEEFRKVEIATMVWMEKREVSDQSKAKDQFQEVWPKIVEVSLKLADGDKSVGKLFLTEALAAYRAKDKLRPDQIAEAFAGAFLVDPVAQL